MYTVSLTLCIAAALPSAPMILEPEFSGPGFKAPIALANGDLLCWRRDWRDGEGWNLTCSRSADAGLNWEPWGVIASDADPTVDFGDGHFAQLPDGTILHAFRWNHHAERESADREFRIAVHASDDGGRTWRPHSTVAEAQGTSHGLWSGFLLVRRDGALQCYYDDEVTPARGGLAGHQWLTMRTYDQTTGEWINPTTVSRAHDDAHLSRDGMPTVVELPTGRLVCALESVDTRVPHPGCLRLVTSDDGGATWDWMAQERPILYQPKDWRFNALAPWMVALPDGRLLCVFTTDEDRSVPGIAATGRLYQDLKCLESKDGGLTWSGSTPLDTEYPIFFPGACVVQTDDGPTVIMQYSQAYRGALVLRVRP